LVLYAVYLTNVGMMLLLLPWSELWAHAVLLLPYRVAVVLDLPTVRGMISAFGALHLALLLIDVVAPGGIGHRHS
jgi:hypothetical protein